MAQAAISALATATATTLGVCFAQSICVGLDVNTISAVMASTSEVNLVSIERAYLTGR